jgi:hypothetical protein
MAQLPCTISPALHRTLELYSRTRKKPEILFERLIRISPTISTPDPVVNLQCTISVFQDSVTHHSPSKSMILFYEVWTADSSVRIVTVPRAYYTHLEHIDPGENMAGFMRFWSGTNLSVVECPSFNDEAVLQLCNDHAPELQDLYIEKLPQCFPCDVEATG